MYLRAVIALFALATTPLVWANPVQQGPQLTTKNSKVTLVHPDEAHANILSTLSAENIINSTDLHSYLMQHHGSANHTIYVYDARKFIDMSTVTIKHGETSLDKRQTNPCFGYTHYWAEQAQHWWDHWVPGSTCYWTGKDKAGASIQINWSRSVAITQSAGVSLDVIKDILSATVGFSVTKTWSHGGAFTCNIPGNSVGQIWIQNKKGWGWVWSEGCQSCNYGGGCGGRFGYNPTAMGSAEAPAENSQNGNGMQLGCSTGQKNTQCYS